MPDPYPPARERLPAFKSLEECVAYQREKKDTFYVTAFMLEVWIGTIIERTVEQYAENKSGRRHLQMGVGWEAWKAVFGQARFGEWGHIMESIGRFAHCDSSESVMMGQVIELVMTEDQHGEPASIAPGDFAEPRDERLATPEVVRRAQFMFRRMAEWMEALVHWRTHWMAATAPIAFGATSERRELAAVGLMQAGFAGLSEHARAWWEFRHDELARQNQGKPEWRLLGQAQSFSKWGQLRQPAVDELTIHWWPLLKRHNWTDRDLRRLLRRVVPQPDAYPLREDKEFADYRQKALGLIKGKNRRDKSAVDGNPTGWKVALAMVGRLAS